MDFDRLPANIFVKILCYLPLHEQIRIARVNKRFEEISRLVISEIRLYERQELICRIDVDSLSNLLQLCSTNLEKISIRCFYRDDAWIETFARFKCPKLICLSIRTTHGVNYFDEIIQKNRNLKRLDLQADQCLNLSGNFIFDKVEALSIRLADDATIRSLTGRFPNLIEFNMAQYQSPISREIFDNFFASCPNLERFKRCGVTNNLANEFRLSTHFCRLDSMRELNLSFTSHFNDYDIQKISTSFPRLEDLCLTHLNLTNVGFVALASLQNLMTLDLGFIPLGLIGVNLDSGVRQLTRCPNLRKCSMAVIITPTTLITLMRYCVRLEDLKVRHLQDIDTIEQAVAVVESFGQFENKKMTIDFYENQIWKSDEVKASLLSLEANENMIKILEKTTTCSFSVNFELF